MNVMSQWLADVFVGLESEGEAVWGYVGIADQVSKDEGILK